MMDFQNGRINLAEDLCIGPDYSFDDFKKTPYYNQQDGIRVIYLEGEKVIDGINYAVSLMFMCEKIYLISLLCCNETFTHKTERERKKLHDEILKKYGITNRKEFTWGTVSSDYDPKGDISSIHITYKHR